MGLGNLSGWRETSQFLWADFSTVLRGKGFLIIFSETGRRPSLQLMHEPLWNLLIQTSTSELTSWLDPGTF